MSFRKFSLAALTLAALSPSISHAGAEDHALKACVNAFAAGLPNSGTPSFKLRYARYARSPISDYYAREFTFTLRANDAKSRSKLASASCSATAQGTVIALRILQANEPVTLASR